MVKRPRGLNSAAKAKKLKEGEQGSSETDNEAQVTIEVDGDPENELAQLKGMYKAFVNEEDADTAEKLLHGVIHECDRMLRNSEGQLLPASFHNVYALSLLAMAKFEGNDCEEGTEDEQITSGSAKASSNGTSNGKANNSKEFVLAALERADRGLEYEPNDWELLFSRAKIRMALADELLNLADPVERYSIACSEVVPLLDEAVKDYESAEQIILPAHDTNKKYTTDQVDSIGMLLQIGDSLGALEVEMTGKEGDDTSTKSLLQAQQRYLEWSKTRWEQILTKVPQGKGKGKTPEDDGDHSYVIVRRANRGMGEFYLAMATPLLNEIEADSDDSEEDGPDEQQKQQEHGTQAKHYLEQALQYLLKAEHEENPSTYVLIAEAQISLANLYPVDSDEQTSLYNEAVSRLKRAQRLGYDNYQELINDLQGH